MNKRPLLNKGFLIRFNGIHVFVPVKGIYVTSKVRLHVAQKLMDYIKCNPELIEKFGITKEHLHQPSFDRLVMDNYLCVKMYDVTFEILQQRKVVLKYRKHFHKKKYKLVYNLGKLRIINV